MKRYNSYEELLRDNGVCLNSDLVYAMQELEGFLSCVGSDGVEDAEQEPTTAFMLELDDKKLEVGVTTIIIEGDEDKDEPDTFINYYWVEEC